MTLELPFAGPSRTWSIENSMIELPKGHPDIPKDWDSSEFGAYQVDGFALRLHEGREYELKTVLVGGGRGGVETPITTEELAQIHIKGQRSYRHIVSVGHKVGIESTSKVTRKGGFLGIGGTKTTEVFQEEKTYGWRFIEYTPIYNLDESLHVGFTRDDVLKAAEKILQKQRDQDHEDALFQMSAQHIGFYPPKTLGEQFPEA